MQLRHLWCRTAQLEVILDFWLYDGQWAIINASWQTERPCCTTMGKSRS